MDYEKYKKIHYIIWSVVAVGVGIGVPALGARLAVFAGEKVFSGGKEVTASVNLAPKDVSVFENPISKKVPSENKIKVVTLDSRALDTSPTSPSAITSDILKRIEQSLPKRTTLHLNSQSFLVADLETGEIILEKEKQKVLPIASLTKLITALVAIDVYDQSDILKVPQSAIFVGGTTGQLKTGEKISVSDLLHALLMQSANDAAETLASNFGREKFIERMNAKSRLLGAFVTQFEDPTGLSKNNVSSSQDLFKIAQYIFKEKPELSALTHIKIFKGKNHTWVNATKFLALSEYVGGKTGYTTEAKRTAVSIFELEPIPLTKRKIAVVILKSSARDQDILAILKHINHDALLVTSVER